MNNGGKQMAVLDHDSFKQETNQFVYFTPKTFHHPKSLEKELVQILQPGSSLVSLSRLDQILQANYSNVNSKNLCMSCWCYCSRY